MIALLITAAALSATPAKALDPGSWVTSSDYPAKSLIEKAHGDVRFRLSIDETGKSDACGILTSSGSQELDSATCDLLLLRARFTPAIGSDGKPIRSSYTSSVRWVLDDRPDPWESAISLIHVDLDEAGAVSGCRESDVTTASFGGCTLFGQTTVLSHVIPFPLSKLRAIEVRFVREASGRPPVDDPIPADATRAVLGGFTITVNAAGRVAACTIDARPPAAGSFDPCAPEITAKVHYVPDGASAARTMRMRLEAVIFARKS